MKKQFRAIILHGAFGTPEENWFPWLAKELESRGIPSVRPKMPTPQGQSLKNWKSEFKKQVGNISNDTILVGHSASPVFLFHILQESPLPVHATFLVSPFIHELGLPDFDRVNATFFKGPFLWDKIKHNAGTILIYGGDNDPYVPLDAMKEVATNLSTDLHILRGAGHINSAAGFNKFPQLLEEIIKVTS